MEEPRGYWGVIPGEVLHDKDLSHAGKLLYLVLSSMAHRNGYCWPSNETLAAELGLSRRRVQQMLGQLQERGYIRVEVQRAEETNEVERRYIYCGLFVGRETPSHSGENPPDPHEKDFTTSCKISQDPHEKDFTCIIGRKNKRENIPPIVPREIFDLCVAYAGEDGALLEAVMGLLENRAAMKKPVKTLRAMKGILTKLDKLSLGDRGAKLALLDKATVSNWLTVFPLKPDELPAAGTGGEEGVTYI